MKQVAESWRNPDGSVNYDDYMSSPEWRRFREGYWKRHPHATCERCGISNSEHRHTFGTRLHLNHRHYRSLACEADEDLEPICKPCHKKEHSGDAAVESLMALVEQPSTATADRNVRRELDWVFDLPEVDWELVALKLIDKRRTEILVAIGKTEGNEELWQKLNWLFFVEGYVRACIELKPFNGSGTVTPECVALK